MKTTNLIMVLIFLVIISGLSYSQNVPQLIFYQGNLADVNGNAINESQNITFSIWDNITDGNRYGKRTIQPYRLTKDYSV